MTASGPASTPWGLLALLWFTGLYLRLPILVAPPLAPLIGAELNLNQKEMGALTTLPVLMLALGALPGSFAIARLGAPRTVALALVLVAAGSAGRGLAPPVLLLFAATVLLGLGVAVMQPALPVLVARWLPARLALGSAVYMNGMLMGEFIGAGLTLPWVMPLLDGDWRWTLVAWSVPAVAPAVVVTMIRIRARESAPTGVPVAWHPPWRDGRLWRLGILLGAASAGFFGTNAYLGGILEGRGQGARLEQALFWFNLAQVAGSLLMLALASRLAGRRWPVPAVAAGVVLGLAGIGFGGDAVFLPALVLLGLSTCLQLILMVSLVPQLVGPDDAGPLAAGMFAVGYLLGFVVPLGGGVLADVTGDPLKALVPLGVLALAALALAVSTALGHGWQPSQSATRSE